MGTESFELKLERFLFSEKSTIGLLYFNGIVIGCTLEPPLSSKKLINEDVYSAIIAPTPHWSRFYGDYRYLYQIRLEDKNGRKGILVHIGNYPSETKGCILVGTSYGVDVINNSALCYHNLVDFLLGFARLASLGKSDSFKFKIVVTHE